MRAWPAFSKLQGYHHTVLTVNMNLDKRLLRLARNSRLALFTTIVLGLITGILTALLAWFLSRTVTRVFLDGSSLADVAQLLSLLLVTILLRALFTWGAEISSSNIAARVKLSLREQLFQHIQALGPQYTRGERTGELINVTVEGIEALDAYYSQYLPQLLLAALVPTTFLIIIFPLDLLTGLILLLTAPLIPVFMILIGSVSKTLTQRQWQSLSRMSAYFLDIIQGLTTLKILGRSKAQVQVVSQVSERFRVATMSVLRVTFLSAFALELVATLSTAIVAVEIGLRLLYGRMSFETAFFLLLLAPEFVF
jgi:ATP-binding cassette subfamily C protein CydD